MGARHSFTVSPCCQVLTRTCHDTQAISAHNGSGAPCVMLNGAGLFSCVDACGEPVGKVFEETMCSLSEVDRQLLRFSSTACAAAVRWLCHLGASRDVRDANRTTCLHVACRAGALPVAIELMRHVPLLDAMDNAEWTPLHVAAHIGRRAVILRLLKARADPTLRNAKGQTPAQLCMEQDMRKILMVPETCISSPGTQLSNGESSISFDDGGEPSPSDFEWFFVKPEAAVKETEAHRSSIVDVAVLIFNRQPSSGLALVVATGVTDTYTAAMKLIQRHPKVSTEQVGDFLGESLSLCSMMRFGVMQAMPLVNTGVVSALTTVFQRLRMPDDLQKVYRLVQCIAVTWWRKHVALESIPFAARNDTGSGAHPRSEEFEGLQLLSHFSSPDVLCQLMFSTVLLHWFLHVNGEGPYKSMTAQAWSMLNTGEDGGGESQIPEQVQTRIYVCIAHHFIPHIALAAGSPLLGEDFEKSGGDSVLAACALVEGWIELPDHHETLAKSKYAFTCWGEMASSRERPVKPCAPCSNKQDSCMWVSLCSIFLLFASHPEDEVPHSLIDVRRIHVAAVAWEALAITLEGVPFEEKPSPIVVVRLLPDGRFQQMILPRLEMKFQAHDDLYKWVTCLNQPVSPVLL
mmetsp:Transcript_29872/g.81997  ORF Transcript_29872/g.81997 Transcript_29872/m.81997 type:complete len:631 (-) Transcript_29872:87-1979(-)